MFMPGGSKHDTLSYFSFWYPKTPVIVTNQWMEQGNMSPLAQLVPSWLFIMTKIKLGWGVKPGPQAFSFSFAPLCRLARCSC